MSQIFNVWSSVERLPRLFQFASYTTDTRIPVQCNSRALLCVGVTYVHIIAFCPIGKDTGLLHSPLTYTCCV